MPSGTKRRSVGAHDTSGHSNYTMYKDEEADPPALVCQVGPPRSGTTCGQLRTSTRGWWSRDWVLLGAADEKKPAADGTVEAWGARPTTGRWLVRVAQRLPREIRNVSPTAARGARPGRSDPRSRNNSMRAS